MSDTLFSTMTLSERLRHYANGCSNLENYTQGALLDFAERVHVLETNLASAEAEAAQWKAKAEAAGEKAEMLDLLAKRLEDGCTDMTIFRGNGFWLIKFLNAGIPRDTGGTEHYEAATLLDTLRRAVEAMKTKG